MQQALTTGQLRNVCGWGKVTCSSKQEEEVKRGRCKQNMDLLAGILQWKGALNFVIFIGKGILKYRMNSDTFVEYKST